jgi:hypothetical protein
MTKTNSSVDTGTLQSWIDERIETSVVRERLSELGLDEISIDNTLKEFKKMKYGRRQTLGFILLATGAFMGFFSFLLTITNPIPGLYVFFSLWAFFSGHFACIYRIGLCYWLS